MPEDLSIRDVVAKLRRAASLRRSEVSVWYVLPPNTFVLVPIGRGWLEGFWPYEAQDARN